MRTLLGAVRPHRPPAQLIYRAFLRLGLGLGALGLVVAGLSGYRLPWWAYVAFAAGWIFVMTSLVSDTRKDKRMDEPEWLSKVVEGHEEIGTWRVVDNEIKLFCAFCQTWCNTQVVLDGPFGPFGPVGVDYAIRPGQNIVQVHLSLSVHVHDHECPKGHEALSSGPTS